MIDAHVAVKGARGRPSRMSLDYRERYQAALARAMRTAREDAGRSQAWIAAEMGVTRPTVGRLEHARSGEITTGTLLRFAHACGTTSSAILALAEMILAEGTSE